MPVSIKAMLTVKWGSPRTKALVPSSGSTRKKRGPMASGVPNSLACSSEITGMSGNRRARRARISVSARRSASVTGLWSALAMTVRPASTAAGSARRPRRRSRRGSAARSVGGCRFHAALNGARGSSPPPPPPPPTPPPSQSAKSGGCSHADDARSGPAFHPGPAVTPPPSAPRSWLPRWRRSFATTSSARLARSSPASDLLDDPAAKDMRDEAMDLIASSARKLVDQLPFARVAFGSVAGGRRSTAPSWSA